MIEKIRKIIERAVSPGIKFLVMASEKPEFGHYSTNVGFFLKENLENVAKEILHRQLAVRDDKTPLFEKVEVKGKFINFWISKSALIEELIIALRSTNLYETTRKIKKQEINLEFISANPTGPLTMANGRGGFLGDVLANVLEAVGNKVTREYYINDAGNQIRLLGESILAVLGKMETKEEHYKGEYIKKLASILGHRMTWGSSDDRSIEDIGRLAAAELLKEIKKSLKNVGIKFDVWFSEYGKLRKGSEIKKVLELLEKKGLVEKKEGASWLKSGDVADEKDRVLVKSGQPIRQAQGEPTYFLADLAYHYDKLVKRKFDKAIDIWGADHHGYVARLKAGIKAIGEDPEKLTIIITQLVRLVEGGKEVKMSKRTGEFVTLDDLIKEVGKDATRFFFLLHTPESHMDFDLALAKEKSQKNPVYYVQYAYVRCGSILQKSKIKNQNSKLQFKIKNLQAESEINLIRELIKLPDLVLQTAEDYQVSRLARYAMELAKAVHNFYEKERVLPADAEAMAGEGREIMMARLALVAATREILGRLFDLLGISKPEKM